MALDTAALLSAVQSHASSLGEFDRVSGHEPKNPPGHGVTCAVMLRRIRPFPQGSGLAATSALVTLVVRLYKPVAGAPADEVETTLARAVDALVAAYSGDFTLGGIACQVDLLGRGGTALAADLGWIQQDGSALRTADITLPIILNDVWVQAP
jgi:hypothetical protein